MMKKTKKVRWDPIIAKLADNKLKQKICTDANNHNITSTSKVKGLIISLKKLSKEDFQTFLYVLSDPGGPILKCQNPDVLRVHLRKIKDR